MILSPNPSSVPYTPGRSRFSLGDLGSLGLGDTTNASIGAGAAGANLGLMVAAGASAIPVAGAIIAAGVALAGLIESIISSSGCGQTCVISSQDANRIGDAMTANLNAYLASPRTQADQAAALANFDYAWAQLQQLCGNSQLGDAGARCISDRQQGACAWKSSPGAWVAGASGSYTWVPPGPAGSGTACWNYFVGMRDPIASDPDVAANTAAAIASGAGTGSSGSSLLDSAASSVGLSPTMLLLILGGLLLFSGSSSPAPKGRYA